MQNRYSGDIGDYSKFVLLKKLFPSTNYKIGLVWYLYPDESHNGDGRHTGYVHKQEYLECDSELIAGLSNVISGVRSIKELERATPLPKGTVYFSDPLDFHHRFPLQTIEHKNLRHESRIQWLQSAREAVKECNVVMLDPDNGLEIKSCPKINLGKSGKYAYYREVQEFFNLGTICVVYHHLNRTMSHQSQIQLRAKELKEKVSGVETVFCVRFAPYSPRAYFILSRSEELGMVQRRLEAFLGSFCGVGWDSYFKYN